MARVVKKPEVRRREIVVASRSLFLEKGYENTTMQEVMTKLKIAKGTAYHYFKSKEELLDAVVQDMVSEYIVVIEKALNECKGNAVERLKVLFQTGRVAGKEMRVIEDLHTPGNMGLHVRLLAVTLSRLASLYAQVISQGCKEGVFQVENPLECAEMLLAGIQFVTDIGFYPWSKQDLKRRAEAIPSYIENQLHAQKGTLQFYCENSGNL